jgi:hypothetical protein
MCAAKRAWVLSLQFAPSAYRWQLSVWLGLQMCATSYSGSGWDGGTCIVGLIEIFKEPWLHTRFNGLKFLSHSFNTKMHPDNCQGPFLF